MRSDLADLVIFFSLSLRLGTVAVSRRTRNLSRPRARTATTRVLTGRTLPVRGVTAKKARKDLGLVEFCEQYETIELWFDPEPNDSTATDLAARLFPLSSGDRGQVEDCALLISRSDQASPRQLGKWKLPAVDVTSDELETASAAWQAYRAATPEACFDLLSKDLSALPLLKPALLDLLEELPSSCDRAWRDGNADARADRERVYSRTNALFHLRAACARRRVFNELENRLPARWACAWSAPGRGRSRRRAAHARDEKTCGIALERTSEADCR